MPHIDVKCQPKHLSEQEFSDFVADLNRLVQKHLKSGEEYISIAYTEITPEDWKAVYDAEIKPNLGKLAKTPGYEM